MRLRPIGAAVTALAVLVAAAACSPSMSGGSPGATHGTVELTVYAAASLEEVLADVERAYAAAVPTTRLTIATGASSTLRAQIEQGAPADVLLSADEANTRALVEAGLADGKTVEFASSRLAVIVPNDNPGGVTSPADLARPGIEVIAAGDSVPITRYAEQVLVNLASQPGYPRDFAPAVAANVVSREENVSAVVAKIRLGEGDAAIVYSTDAMAAPDVQTIEIPEAANVAARYAGVVVRHTAHAAAAHAFLDWLAGPNGAAILETFGFGRPT